MNQSIASRENVRRWVSAAVEGFRSRRIRSLAGALLVAVGTTGAAFGASLGLAENLLLERADSAAFPLVAERRAAPVFVDPGDYAGVLRAASDLCADVERVSGVRPALMGSGKTPVGESVVIAGTFGHSPLIDQLIRAGKIPTAGLEGKWESFSISTVVNPLPGVARALVIVGSDIFT